MFVFGSDFAAITDPCADASEADDGDDDAPADDELDGPLCTVCRFGDVCVNFVAAAAAARSVRRVRVVVLDALVILVLTLLFVSPKDARLQTTAHVSKTESVNPEFTNGTVQLNTQTTENTTSRWKRERNPTHG